MIDVKSRYTIARNFAVNLLANMQTRTHEDIREIAEHAARSVRTMSADQHPIDVEALRAELEHLFSVVVDDATALDDNDPTAHVEWLHSTRAERRWPFWTRYREYLENAVGLAPAVVNNLDKQTDMIMERLEDPSRDGPWDRRGMVVGSVQSGKTANYIGLICKAVDAGYKLIIVLAGIHSNLRSQTQLRIDEGVLGFDTKKSRRLDAASRWIGVGTYGERLHIHSLTSSAEDGDFSKRVADTIGVMIGGDPIVLVIKKNSRLLENLLAWILHVAGTDSQQDPTQVPRRMVRNYPLLLIDDEADNASINVKAKRAGSSVLRARRRIS